MNTTGTYESVNTFESSLESNTKDSDTFIWYSTQIFTPTQRIIFFSVFLILGLFGVFANGLTIFVIMKNKELKKSPFNILLVSLCISDFLSASNSSIQSYSLLWSLRAYTGPEFFCKLSHSVRVWTEYVTVQHILIFSIVRLYAMKCPMRVKRVFTPSMATITAAVIWLEVFLTAAIFRYKFPTVYPVQPDAEYSGCIAVPLEWKEALKLHKFTVPFMFFLPMSGIIGCAVYLAVTIYRMRHCDIPRTPSPDRIRNENKAILQVSLIVLSFILGYLGNAVNRVLVSLPIYYTIPLVSRSWFTFTCYLLLRLSECLNPVFYSLGSDTLMKATKQLFSKKKLAPVGGRNKKLQSSYNISGAVSRARKSAT
ncbi:galanin receptor 2b-like [Styela clava]